MEAKHSVNKVTAGALLITLGIIYGDIGTSPLYVMKAIFGNSPINSNLVLGAVSCVLWTLTLQTSIKYVWLTLQADNKGEGGIFSLYTLVKKLKKKWLIVPALIGGSAMLADGFITPPISISSALEGVKIYYPDLKTIPFVIGIILVLFFFQSYGTKTIGKFFGPIMLIWFLMLGGVGLLQITQVPEILKAVNPYYAYLLLTEHPEGFYVLGFVFLCTTGAEALYSDLGHCGIKNIRLSWMFVKTTLALNYLGQGAFLLSHTNIQLKTFDNGVEFIQNPFYLMMPEWFIPIGIVVATLAAVIAAQALITGSFTMINEAMRLNLWPRVLVKYPSNIKGQLYIPSTNWILCIGCILVVLYFKESSNMEAAYGLAIIMCMIATSILLTYYMILKRFNKLIIVAFVLIYSVIEVSFFIANIDKFHHGGYVSLIVAGAIAFVMTIWFLGKRIRKNYTEFVKLSDYTSVIEDLSNDESIPQYSNNLIYLTNAHNKNEIESKVIYSILYKRPKRADVYWMLHVNVIDEPYGMEYQIKKFSDKIMRVDFYLGFRIAPKISPLFKKVLEDLSMCGEFNRLSTYHSLRKNQITADHKYIIIEKVVSFDNDLPWYEKFILDCYAFIRRRSLSEEKAFGLDNSSVKIEYYPLLLNKNLPDIPLKRRADKKE
ncbi:KUP/HAK/KT family potassium transporter [Paenimyroides baculatum]|uniref:Probable potassium transport system protein Kup n=1 Tax=Paenimyroides baculatum TaxID=2608000 RepID=A0A5M6CFY0_9FLAO|nr:KUP/HAK/KT family potassium transporter [Paenimyroides baculatum]KAA5533947.1 KUP/HAK/KT family potassium transporter [Paenimyroides baculatum]